jgi:prophage regulatory protein
MHKPPIIERLPTVQERVGYSRTTIDRKVKDGTFPKPIKLSPGQGGAIGWRASDIDAWIDARFNGREWKPTDGE